jgi:hypothetical protein
MRINTNIHIRADYASFEAVMRRNAFLQIDQRNMDRWHKTVEEIKSLTSECLECKFTSLAYACMCIQLIEATLHTFVLFKMLKDGRCQKDIEQQVA